MEEIRVAGRVFSSEPGAPNKILSGNCYLSTSLTSSQLEANTMSFTINSEDTSLTGIQRMAPLWYYQDGKKIGVFYIQEIQRKSATKYYFFATSTVGLLDERRHYGGIYTGQTAAEVVSDICGTTPFYLKNELKDIQLYGWLPIATARENLWQVLIAIGAWIKNDLDGVLRIEGLWDGITSSIVRGRISRKAMVKYASKVTQVEITEHQYIAGEEEKKLFEGTTRQGDIVTFSDPMHSLTTVGFNILERGANYAKLSAGTGVLSGKAYIHNTRQISKQVADAREPNVKTVSECTLISLVNSQAVAERMANYYQWTETISAPIVYQGEQPGDRLLTHHPFDGNNVAACLQSADINLSNTLKAQEKLLVGFVPPKPSTGYINKRVVLTGAGFFQRPEGAERITYVLISGAQGGKAGRKGESGTEARSFSFVQDAGEFGRTTYTGKCGGKGGLGGTGGEPGQGGRILRGDLDVSGLSEIPYSCGIGGLGAVYSESDPDAEGQLGGDTIFGPVSSAAGVSSESGYTDTITQETYAVLGKTGLPGGNGGGIEETSITAETVNKFVNATGAVDEDGNIWPGGSTKTQEDPTLLYAGGESVTLAASLSRGGAGSTVGLGSGGAAGSPGRNGGSSVGTYSAWVNLDKTMALLRADTQMGRRGADAILTPKKATDGQGGRGGYGGGGGSSPSSASTWTRNAAGTTVTAETTASNPGEGGNPGPGGQGADGLIILYYSIPATADGGPLATADNKWFVDKHGRRFIV